MKITKTVVTFFVASVPVAGLVCWVDVDPLPCPSTVPLGEGGWQCTGTLSPAGATYPWVSSASSGKANMSATAPECHYTCTATNESGLTRPLVGDFYTGAKATGTSCSGGTL